MWVNIKYSTTHICEHNETSHCSLLPVVLPTFFFKNYSFFYNGMLSFSFAITGWTLISNYFNTQKAEKEAKLYLNYIDKFWKVNLIHIDHIFVLCISYHMSYLSFWTGLFHRWFPVYSFYYKIHYFLFCCDWVVFYRVIYYNMFSLSRNLLMNICVDCVSRLLWIILSSTWVHR